jgi:nucleoside-triphosphatase
LKKRLLLLSGNPGVGKTTILLKVAEDLKTRGYSVGGMISREARRSGSRVGFEIVDLGSGKSGWLAHTDQEMGPQVGKYRVNLKDLNDIGVKAIANAIAKCDVIVIDEMGPMELFSGKFKEAVVKAAESTKLVIGIVHWKARDRLIDETRKREDAEVYTVTSENRQSLHEVLTARALDFLSNAQENKVL